MASPFNYQLHLTVQFAIILRDIHQKPGKNIIKKWITLFLLYIFQIYCKNLDIVSYIDCLFRNV